MRLFSQVNGDSDIIEAWLNYYLRLGVDWFHIILHGPPSENERLLTIKDSYPITIEESYEGPFPEPIDPYFPTKTEKKRRLDALLARHTGQWVMLVDSDEFVEFPYPDVAETIRKLEFAGANMMAAPMLQRLTVDGALETPPRIDNPFEFFPLCSVDVYWRIGMKAEIFKFPLFYCVKGTELAGEGNHNPPLGQEPVDVGIVGVTHHFKFRRSVRGRLEKRLTSPHAWRHESLGCRDYLDSHGGRLPLDSAFPYSREELFRRQLLRQLPPPKARLELSALPQTDCGENTFSTSVSDTTPPAGAKGRTEVSSPPAAKKVAFVLPNEAEYFGLERHVLELLRRLPETREPHVVICFGKDSISACMDKGQLARTIVKCVEEPRSFWDWLQVYRKSAPAVVIFCSPSILSFPWHAPIASLLAGVHRRISIQYFAPPPLPMPLQGNSLRNRLRRWLGRRARHAAKVRWSARISGYAWSATVCVCAAVRDALVGTYGFRPEKTAVIFRGVSPSTFVASRGNREAVRSWFDIGPDEFVLVCVARLIEVNGLDLVIQAVSRAVRQGIPCKCIIVGDGLLGEELRRLANALGLSRHVFFEGFQHDVRPYLQAGSAFILTSREEGLPLSILEAMACGLPCIVTNVGGNAEAVKDQVNGLVIPPGSAEAAGDAILYLATNPGRRAEMACKAREIVVRDFDVEDRFNDFRPILLG